MAVAQSQLVDVDVTRYSHCIPRCVRRSVLCGEGFKHRKLWIKQRLETLSTCFAVSVCGFAVMDRRPGGRGSGTRLVAVPRRRPASAGRWPGRDAGGVLAGQLSVAGGHHRASVSAGQGPAAPGIGLDSGAVGDHRRGGAADAEVVREDSPANPQVLVDRVRLVR